MSDSDPTGDRDETAGAGDAEGDDPADVDDPLDWGGSGSEPGDGEESALDPDPEGGDTAAALSEVLDVEETAIVLYDHPVVTEVLTDVKEYFAEQADGLVDPPDDEFIATNFFDFDYLDGVRHVSWKWVNEPFAFVSVVYDPADSAHRYRVVEPTLDDFEHYVREDLIELLRNNLMYRDFEESDRESAFRREAQALIEDEAATVEPGTIHKLLYYLIRDFVDYGPIDPIMRDDDVEDISCDGHDVPVFVYHRSHRDLRTNVRFDKEHLDAYTYRLAQRAGKQMTVSNPLVDATLPNGSRIQLTLGGEISTRGSNFTIRKFSETPFTPVELAAWNTFSIEQLAYFWLAIENNKSLIFAGGTGSGKTSSLNAVSFFIPPTNKVVSIEDTREIDLPHENWIQSVTREGISGEGRGEVSMYNLLQASLRQRPEYLLVGEIRTEERVALTFFQAMATGHTSYTTLHADSIETVLSRLQNPPLNVPTQMVQELDIVSVQRQTYREDSRVRRNHSVTEIHPGETPDRLATHEVFRRDAATDTHEQVGDSKLMAEIAEDRGWNRQELETELDRRERVLRYLLEGDIKDYAAVGRAIRRYHTEPDALVAEVENGTLTGADLRGEGPDLEAVEPTDLDVQELVEGL